MSKIKAYQKKCWNEYKEKLGLVDYTYGYGNPVKVHVPVDIATRGIMIVGAYPTAQFNTIKSITDVPVADHLYPFSDESYFDGSRFRPVKSGAELSKHYLEPLEVKREDCWITDLVKVFLFKPGHVKKYKKLRFPKPDVLRKDFKKYARSSMPFLEEEIKLAKPKVILLLGTEVISVVLGVSDIEAKALMKPEQINREFGGNKYPVFALPHPGIIMRNSEAGRKYRKILKKQLKYINNYYLNKD